MRTCGTARGARSRTSQRETPETNRGEAHIAERGRTQHKRPRRRKRVELARHYETRAEGGALCERRPRASLRAVRPKANRQTRRNGGSEGEKSGGSAGSEAHGAPHARRAWSRRAHTLQTKVRRAKRDRITERRRDCCRDIAAGVPKR